VVPLGEVAAQYTKLYLEKARPVLAAWNREPSNTLFLTYRGKKLTEATLGKFIHDYAKAAGITKTITPHSFRHTCATHMLKGHANIRHIQELLGHKNLNTTQIYTHVEIGDLKVEHRRTHPRERPAPPSSHV
jgi:integrase/recombinase XerD